MSAKTEPPVGRAGGKLEAALDGFALCAAVRNAHAVDIGSSTGGFTRVLLARGARDVLAVDVGRAQLHESLRHDPRVHLLEGTDWKRLSLSEAPGPFDFFTVDVAFVAARSMLRGLAFRLRAGAEGVVLVKPQFELPDRLVKGGDVQDPTLRRAAVERFSQKAARLGFRVVAHFDSPVAGGRGTVEILAHLRFEGRPATLPQPGERRRAAASPSDGKPRSEGKLAKLPELLEWFAVVTPGAEEVAAIEAARVLGSDLVRSVPGGVEIRGSLAVGTRANLHLRIPTRVLLRIGAARAREFGQLRHQLARLPWEAWIPDHAAIRIAVTTMRCRLYHTGAIDETVRAAIGDRTGRAPPPAKTDEETASGETSAGPVEEPISVFVRGVADRWTISLDSSGDRLHRRGWREEGGPAPLRESLASALLALAEWRTDEALVDPMCGAGTIAIEASLAALAVAPGLRRSFVFERWPSFASEDRSRWISEKEAAEQARLPQLATPIVASDRAPAAVEAARRNAARAGVAAQLTILQREVVDAEPPAGSGLVIANPPFGRRIGQTRDLPKLYRDFGRMLRLRFGGWRAAVLVSDPRLASAFRLPVTSSHALLHGGLRVTLLRFNCGA